MDGIRHVAEIIPEVMDYIIKCSYDYRIKNKSEKSAEKIEVEHDISSGNKESIAIVFN